MQKKTDSNYYQVMEGHNVNKKVFIGRKACKNVFQILLPLSSFYIEYDNILSEQKRDFSILKPFSG